MTNKVRRMARNMLNFIYECYGILASTRGERLQRAFNVLTNLFNRVGLIKKSLQKHTTYYVLRNNFQNQKKRDGTNGAHHCLPLPWHRIFFSVLRITVQNIVCCVLTNFQTGLPHGSDHIGSLGGPMNMLPPHNLPSPNKLAGDVGL